MVDHALGQPAPEQAVEHRLLLPFAGPGTGTAPLTWGQKAVLKEMRATGWSLNLSGAQPLDDGTTIDDVADQLRHYMCTYPAARMRVGTDEHGAPCQVVSPSGEIALDIIDIAEGGDPGQVAIDLRQSHLLTPFDLNNDWPMRMAVICQHGKPMYRVWTLSHLIVDGTAVALLMADIGMGDLAGRVTGDPRTVGLLELGWREQTPAVRRISDIAMRYWEPRLRSIPRLTFGEPTHPQGRLGKRYWHSRANSPATYLAMLAIAARTKTDTSHVLLALLAIAVARATGANPVTARLIVSNRFRPGFAEAIAPLGQDSVLTIDVADATVDEVVARAGKASLLAAKHAYYDPDQLDGLSARLDRERGHSGRITLRINDRRIHTRRLAEQAARDCHVTKQQIEKAVPDSVLAWDAALDYIHDQVFIMVDDYNDTIHLRMNLDMACLTETDVEALVRGVEMVAVEAAFDRAVPTRVTSAPGLI